MAGKTYATALLISVSRCNIGSKDTKSDKVHIMV